MRRRKSAPRSRMPWPATACRRGWKTPIRRSSRIWRRGSEEILQRIVTEARGGHFAVDVAETAAPQIVPLDREKLLHAFETPLRADLMPGTIMKGAAWLPSRLVVFTGAYNTNLIP